MRHLRTLALAAALLSLAAAPALAQRNGGGTPTAATLLANKGVQDELKLTDDEKDKLTKITDKYKDDLAAARQAMDRAKVRELTGKLNDDVTKAVPDILTKDQSKRLDQILFQVGGFAAFAKDDVQTALKLTDKQKKDYADAKADLDKQVKDLMDAAAGDRTKRREARQKAQTMSAEALDKFMATFTDDQKKAYKDLAGDKFDYKPTTGRNRSNAPPADK
jgi:hypothetical protein